MPASASWMVPEYNIEDFVTDVSSNINSEDIRTSLDSLRVRDEARDLRRGVEYGRIYTDEMLAYDYNLYNRKPLKEYTKSGYYYK